MQHVDERRRGTWRSRTLSAVFAMGLAVVAMIATALPASAQTTFYLVNNGYCSDGNYRYDRTLKTTATVGNTRGVDSAYLLMRIGWCAAPSSRFTTQFPPQILSTNGGVTQWGAQSGLDYSGPLERSASQLPGGGYQLTFYYSLTRPANASFTGCFGANGSNVSGTICGNWNPRPETWQFRMSVIVYPPTDAGQRTRVDCTSAVAGGTSGNASQRCELTN